MKSTKKVVLKWNQRNRIKDGIRKMKDVMHLTAGENQYLIWRFYFVGKNASSHSL